jgi:two-component sensor histidine kinase
MEPMIDPSNACGARVCVPQPFADANRLRQTIAVCGLGLWEWHVTDNRWLIDHVACDLLGLPAGTSFVLMAELLRIVDEPDMALLKQAILDSFGSESDLAYEVKVQRRDTGEIRCLALKACIAERDSDGAPLIVAGLAFDITRARREQEAKDFLNQELAHRMKNMLSVVGSIVTLSGEHRPEAREFVAAFQSRLGSLAATHGLLTQADWQPIALGQLFEKVLAPLGVLPRIDVAGQRDVLLGAHDAQTLALVLHELATNAIKYGALSNGEGRVALLIEVAKGVRRDEQPLLVLRWEEIGGPAVTAPGDKGFGLTLLERLTRRNAQVEPVLQWGPGGLVCSFAMRMTPEAGR